MTEPTPPPAKSGRKPPPNWAAKYRDLLDTNAELHQHNNRLRQLHEQALAQLSYVRRMLTYYTSLDLAAHRLVMAMSQPWWKRNKADIVQERAQIRNLKDSVYRELARAPAADEPGNIRGLAVRAQGSTSGLDEYRNQEWGDPTQPTSAQSFSNARSQKPQ